MNKCMYVYNICIYNIFFYVIPSVQHTVHTHIYTVTELFLSHFADPRRRRHPPPHHHRRLPHHPPRP